MKITISAHQHIEAFSRVPVYARVYASNDFLNEDGETVAGSEITSDNYVKQVSASYASGITTISSFATTNRIDSTIMPASGRVLATYCLTLHDTNGVYICTVFENIKIPDSPTTTLWADLAQVSTALSIPYRAEYFNREESDARYLGVTTAPLSNLTTYGRGRTDIDPVSLFDPAFVGVNSPRVSTVLSASEYGNSLVTAIAAIGATPTTLVVKADTTVSTAIVIPATLFLKPENGAAITKAGAGAITFSGVGIVGDPRHQILSGFAVADLTWTSAMPEFWVEWVGGKGDNSTDNTAALTLALDIVRKSSPAGNRRGGVVQLWGGIYKCASVVGTGFTGPNPYLYNVRLEGNGTKAVGNGSNGGTILLYTGTGDRAFDFRSSQGTSINNLSILYEPGFTGTLLDFSMVSGVGGSNVRITNSFIGGNYVSTQAVDAANLVYLSGVYDVQISKTTFAGAQVGIRLNPGGAGGTNDGNAITIDGCRFEQLFRAGIMNPYQGMTISNNTFEGTLNVGQTNIASINGGLPWAIDYDYADTQLIYGLNIFGNWFGDRTSVGRGYVRLPSVSGGLISGNFFGGGGGSAGRYAAEGSGTIGLTTLTVSSGPFFNYSVGARVWVPSIAYTATITGYISATQVTVDTVFPSTFAAADVNITGTSVREYTSNISGTIGTKILTVGTVIVPGDAAGKYFWIPSIDFVSKIVTASGSTVTITDNLPSTITNTSGQIGEYLNNPTAIELGRGSNLAISGNHFGNGMHAVNFGDLIYRQLTDISVTNASAVVTGVSADWAEGFIVGKVFLPVSAGFTVPGGTTVLSIVGSPTGTSMTLSNPVTVTSGTSPRIANLQFNSPGNSRVFMSGNPFPSTDGLAEPVTDSSIQALYNISGSRVTLSANSGDDYSTNNQGFFTEDFGGADGVMVIGNRTTAPTTNPASGFIFYGESGAPKVRQSDGSIYTLKDSQPLDSDLTAFAAISPSNDDIVQRKAGAWTNRTPAQVKIDLALENVTNTSDANKPVSTAQQTALDLKAPLASPTLTGTPAIAAATGTSLQVTGLLKSSSPTAGIGYSTGAGGAQTQATSKATTVVSNTITTLITMHNAILNAGVIVSFTFTNSSIAATDHILINHESGGTVGSYTFAGTPGAGTSTIFVRNATAGNLTEAIVVRVTVIKAVSS